jgi:hypothetical protein
MAIDTDKIARLLTFHLTARDNTIFLTQITHKQVNKKKSLNIAGTIFKFINKGER